MTSHVKSRLIGIVGCVVALVATFLFGIEPWSLRWGATDEEVQEPLPGDEIIPMASGQETRAITVDAPAIVAIVTAVLPWKAERAVAWSDKLNPA